MAKPDPYADIDFEEINDQTNLANDEIKCLKVTDCSLCMPCDQQRVQLSGPFSSEFLRVKALLFFYSKLLITLKV